MRFLSILLLAAAALVAAWLGGETWLAGKAQRIIAQDPRISAAVVAPLRQLNRIGLHLEDISIEAPSGVAALPSLDLWAAPTSPNHFRAELPAQLRLPLLGRNRQVAASDAALALRVSPGSDMAISLMSAHSGPVVIDGAPLLAQLRAEARLAPIGAQAPQTARAAYTITAEWDRLGSGGLLDLPGPLSAAMLSGTGTAQVFLTGPLRPGGPEPQLSGIALPGFTLTLGSQSLRVAGRLVADSDGRAEGGLFFYTDDARAWMQLAGDLGLIPPRMVVLAGTALEQIAATEVEPPATGPSLSIAAASVNAPPAPAPGELRIPLIFRDGRMFLGPLPLGEAPRFSR